METQIIESLTENFEAHANKTENGIEFWFARDLQNLLGYTEWRNFFNIIFKAKTTCEISGSNISDRFVDINKTIKIRANNIPNFYDQNREKNYQS